MRNIYNRFKRLFNPRMLRYLKSDPSAIVTAMHHHLADGRILPADTLLSRRLVHVANFTTGNAGDAVLTTVLRDLFSQSIGGISWSKLHAHDVVGEAELRRINRATGVIIGGGGLFLRDSNPNRVSGWQWPVSLAALSRIEVPLVIFAVGYNRFRNQGEFDDLFAENVRAVVDKAAFVGLRNNGSVRSIRTYLPKSQHQKVVFQPCMTTLIRKVYPEHFDSPMSTENVIGLNCAFDRSSSRFGVRKAEILDELALAMKDLAQKFCIRYYAHSRSDLDFLPYLERAGVKHDVCRLYHRSGLDIINEYRKPLLVIGMRGHAQMIPFGCGTPILSLISHDKMRWFLDDLGHPEWGAEVMESNLRPRLAAQAEKIIAERDAVLEEMAACQERLFDTTLRNMKFVRTALVGAPVRKIL